MRSVIGSLAVVAVAATVLAPPRAEACALFRLALTASDDQVPTLAVEQTLLIYDEAKLREHFIREIRVEGGDRTFGFVVPLPAKPEIAKVAKRLFEGLQKDLPFDRPLPPPKFVTKGLQPTTPPPVEVLETKKVGRFTATTLTATTGGELRAWLTTHGFDAPPSTARWMDHYVRLGFVFVAFKLDGKANAQGGTLVSETVRLSFDTPVPFYPYLEPDPRDGLTRPRLLRAWTVTPWSADAIASVTISGPEVGFESPWSSGSPYDKKELTDALPADIAKLVPSGPVFVQTWRERNRSRKGMGDLFLRPMNAVPPDEARRQRLLPMLRVFDPALLEGEVPVTVRTPEDVDAMIEAARVERGSSR